MGCEERFSFIRETAARWKSLKIVGFVATRDPGFELGWEAGIRSHSQRAEDEIEVEDRGELECD